MARDRKWPMMMSVGWWTVGMIQREAPMDTVSV